MTVKSMSMVCCDRRGCQRFARTPETDVNKRIWYFTIREGNIVSFCELHKLDEMKIDVEAMKQHEGFVLA